VKRRMSSSRRFAEIGCRLTLASLKLISSLSRPSSRLLVVRIPAKPVTDPCNVVWYTMCSRSLFRSP